jgi:hypothetical protein
MPRKHDEANRKDILRKLRDAERQQTRDAFPVSPPVLQQLFNYLDDRLSTADCDHTLRFTYEFMIRDSLQETKIVSWLDQNGGHCDCEVLSNVEEIVSEATAQSP